MKYGTKYREQMILNHANEHTNTQIEQLLDCLFSGKCTCFQVYFWHAEN